MKDSKKPFSVRLDPKSLAQIDVIAKERGCTRSQVVQRALDLFLSGNTDTGTIAKSYFAKAVYEALVKELELGSILYLENPVTKEKNRVIFPIIK